jgi:hypothetical protein
LEEVFWGFVEVFEGLEECFAGSDEAFGGFVEVGKGLAEAGGLVRERKSPGRCSSTSPAWVAFGSGKLKA